MKTLATVHTHTYTIYVNGGTYTTEADGTQEFMFDLENPNATVYLNDIKYSGEPTAVYNGELLKLQEVITVARQTAGIILILQRFAVQIQQT